MKILILKPSSLGDVIQALPVLRLIKRQFPSSEIYWWLDSRLTALLEADPDLAGIYSFHRRRWSSPFYWNEMLRSIREMRRQKFDWVIDLQGLARSGVFAWLANGDLTVGVADKREGASGFYDRAVPRPSFHTHAVDWYLAVAESLGVRVTQDFEWLPARRNAKAVVDTMAGAGRRWIAINPGARWANKRWPSEYFAQLVAGLAEANPDAHFAVLGDKGDAPLAATIVAAAPERSLDLAGKTSLQEMIEWVRRSEFMVTNDTGPMHVAAALRKPVVSLFGPTEPRRTGPYGQEQHALRIPLWCSPCLSARCRNPNTMECLRSITPEAVHSQITRRFSGQVA